MTFSTAMVARALGTAHGAMIGRIFVAGATDMAVVMATGTALVTVADMGVATVGLRSAGYLLTAPRKLFDFSSPGSPWRAFSSLGPGMGPRTARQKTAR